MARTGKPIEPWIYFHPGETLGEKLEEMNLSPAQFSALSGLEEKKIISIISCKTDIDREIAETLEKSTHIPTDFWLTSQNNYNIYMMKKLAESLTDNLKKNTPYEKKKERSRLTINKMSKLLAAMA